MKRMALHSLIAVLLLASALRAETPGTFRGKVVRPPRHQRTPDLLYLMGGDGNVRLVVVAKAAIVYDPAVPAADRIKPARQALVPGAEVRITALMDATSGEWTASRVEVISRHPAELEPDYGEDESEPDEVTAPHGAFVASRTISSR